MDKTICSFLIVLSISLSFLPVSTIFAEPPDAAAAENPAEAPLPETNDAADGVLIVIPARYTVVQFAFDIAKIRTVKLIAYETPERGKDAIIHTWDQEIQDWIRIDGKQYETKSMLSITPKEIVVVGADQDIPGSLARIPSWCPNQTRLPSLDLAVFVNTLNRSLRFTGKEWKWLAGRYGFKLKDRNDERRRYGRYGKPGEKKSDAFKMPEPVSTPEPVSAPAPVVTPEPVPPAAKDAGHEDNELTPLIKEAIAPTAQEEVAPLPEDK